jgi:large subunit ribosomal protein L2
MSGNDFADLTKGATVEKSLVTKQSKNGGRNNNGRITVRHKGGGHKQRYRLVDFKRNKLNVLGKVDLI